ncbi:hypothetical protein HX109_05540 [Galbibacter sp. BG1]|uniref:hypothetical protein n=1 Tax=Galbibacter sp. BG1 TaxID=1170699 RepID=UPI0015B7CD39|nr:hypothetical protein [Galbibacter sp. BG1]QLE01052.1 hypothetical protein HX109_05540 [Galbibacter sp. BG1]
MKKLFFYFLLVLFVITLNGCSNDDDNGDVCRVCEVRNLELRICDEGNGTISVASGDQIRIIEANGLDFELISDDVGNGEIEVEFDRIDMGIALD